jgi:hypothetical protein
MPIIGPISQEALDVTATAGGLTATAAKGIPPAAAECVVSEGTIRYCTDGTTATEDIGLPASPGDIFYLKNRGEVAGFSAIRVGAENARVDVTFAVDYKP